MPCSRISLCPMRATLALPCRIKFWQTANVGYLMETVAFILIIAIALFMWSKRAKRKSHPLKPDGHIHANGKYSFEAVGEKPYQENLKIICGQPNYQGYNLEKTALLVLEDDNPYDDKAVRVSIDGLTVGYLPSALARDYRQKLAEAGKPNILCSCPALIRGGWNRGKNDKGPFGVLLDLPRNR